jgi:hypothetical protein
MSQARPKQETPEELVNRLLGTVRGQFCGDLADKEWFQMSGFVRRNVILWSAAFVTGKGFTMPPQRFESVLQGVFTEIKQHGQTGQIRYWPGYLMKCVQDHWRHHWEDYYKEAKAVRNIAEAALVNAGKAAPTDKTVDTLAAAYRVLAGTKRKSKVARAPKQLNLLDA